MDEGDRDALLDLAEHGEEALGYLAGISRTRFRQDRRLVLVTERLLEIVGEAAARLSDDARAEVPFDWKAVRGLRNVLAHQYGSIDLDALYATATRELPDLVAKVRAALGPQA